MGEVVAAFIVKQDEGDVKADEIRSWVREKLSHHLGRSRQVHDVNLANEWQCQSMYFG
jgi:hypothetical protein